MSFLNPYRRENGSGKGKVRSGKCQVRLAVWRRRKGKREKQKVKRSGVPTTKEVGIES